MKSRIIMKNSDPCYWLSAWISHWTLHLQYLCATVQIFNSHQVPKLRQELHSRWLLRQRGGLLSAMKCIECKWWVKAWVSAIMGKLHGETFDSPSFFVRLSDKGRQDGIQTTQTSSPLPLPASTGHSSFEISGRMMTTTTQTPAETVRVRPR